MNYQKILLFAFGILIVSLCPGSIYTAALDYNGNPINKNGITLTPETSPLIISSSTQAINLDGLLDKTFGNAGIVSTNFEAPDIALGLALQPDGKIIAVGGSELGGTGDFALARYNVDGSLDTSFGTAGKVTTAFSGGVDTAFAVALQSDGKIVVAGGTDINGTGDIAIARYNYNGSLDTTFNAAGPTPGVITLSLTAGVDQAHGVAIQNNGAIVLVGGTDALGATGDIVILRYTSSGVPDLTFNGTGQIIKSITANQDIAYSVVLQSDGNIVVVGAADTTSVVLRYTYTGSLDTTFNTTGIQTAGISIGFASALQPQGKIIITGTDGGIFGIAQYNPDGSLDSTFGTNGIVTTPDTGTAMAIALQPDGKIIAAGDTAGGGFTLVRYNSNGSLDHSFGSGGMVIFPIGGDTISGIQLQTDNKIIVTGKGGTGFRLNRYINPPTLASFTASYGPVGLI